MDHPLVVKIFYYSIHISSWLPRHKYFWEYIEVLLIITLRTTNINWDCPEQIRMNKPRAIHKVGKKVLTGPLGFLITSWGSLSSSSLPASNKSSVTWCLLPAWGALRAVNWSLHLFLTFRERRAEKSRRFIPLCVHPGAFSPKGVNTFYSFNYGKENKKRRPIAKCPSKKTFCEPVCNRDKS